MNREIKFRAWDKINKKMYPIAGISFTNKDVWLQISDEQIMGANFNEIQIMECTSVKDKNDKEIFEGDIVEITYAYNNGIHKFEVYYDSENAYFSLKEIGSDDLDTLCGWGNQIEIIGNIYQNPELLKN